MRKVLFRHSTGQWW